MDVCTDAIHYGGKNPAKIHLPLPLSLFPQPGYKTHFHFFQNRARAQTNKNHSTKNTESITMDQICYCRKVGKITTSWTDSNPGRRFIGCEQYGREGACGYFVWVDPPMCARSKVVIPGLLRSIGRHEAEKKMLKKKSSRLVVALTASWCFFFCLVLCLLAY